MDVIYSYVLNLRKKNINKDGDLISNESQVNAPWPHLISNLFMYLLGRRLFFTSIFEVSVAFHHPHNSFFLSFAASLDAIAVSVCCHGNATDIMGNL